MPFTIWNNPIVVSAFRVRHRRGGLFVGITAYLLLLAASAAALPHSGLPPLNGSWPFTFLVGLCSVQCVLSGLIAGSATWNSMRNEVVQQTLDFQRVALAPRDILIGKMLGAPATAYLMALATVPFGVMCALTGGVPLHILLLLYLNLATTIVLCGAWGLRIHAEIPDRAHGRGTTIITLLMLYAVTIGFGGLGNLATAPWAAAPVGLLTPLLGIYGVATEEPGIAFPWFGWHMPFLLVTPFAQLLVAGFCFRSMERHLRCPIAPPFSKRMVYLGILLSDVVTAGVLYDMGPWDMTPGPRSAAFCLVHLVVCVLLLLEATPDQDALQSWVWRGRGQAARWLDILVGARAPTGWMLVVCGGIGVVNLSVLVVLPAGWQLGWEVVRDALPVILSAAGVTVLTLLTVGMLLQILMLDGGKDGNVALWILLIPAIGVPHLAGAYLQQPWLLALSPSAWFMSWLSDDPAQAGFGLAGPGQLAGTLAYLPLLVILYGALVGVWALYLHMRLEQLRHEVRAKLRAMSAA